MQAYGHENQSELRVAVTAERMSRRNVSYYAMQRECMSLISILGNE